MGFKGPTPKREERKGWAMGGKGGVERVGRGKEGERKRGEGKVWGMRGEEEDLID